MKDSFLFYKEVVNKKNKTKDDATYKDRISAMNDDIESLFINYDKRFCSDELPLLISFGYTAKDKEDLHKLYSYKSNLFQKLKAEITTTRTNRIINTCQNCTISETNSFDHFVPQGEFAEFVVHPKNLFPSCTICNGHKNVAWRNGSKRVFLNLYIDKLPVEQYLFVNIIVKGKEIETKFYVDNPNGIDPDLYRLIEYHYKKLYLCERFSDNNDSVITELINSIEPYVLKLPLDEIKKAALETSEKNKNAFGHNYWKSTLEIALLNDPAFMTRFV